MRRIQEIKIRRHNRALRFVWPRQRASLIALRHHLPPNTWKLCESVFSGNGCVLRFMCLLSYSRCFFRLATKHLVQSQNVVMSRKHHVSHPQHSFEKGEVHFSIVFGLPLKFRVGKQHARQVAGNPPGGTVRFPSQHKVDAVKEHTGDLEPREFKLIIICQVYTVNWLSYINTPFREAFL